MTTDYAKQLAEIEARQASIEALSDIEHDDGERAHEDRGWLLAQCRAASEALTAAGVPEGGSLAERIGTLGPIAGLMLAAWVNQGAERERFLLLAASKLCDAGLLVERASFPNGDPSPAGQALLDAVYTTFGAPVDVEGMAALAGLDPPKELERLAADAARRAAFNAWPGQPPRIAVLDPAKHLRRPKAARMRESLNAEFGLSITTADLARALRIPEEDMLAIEAGTKTTDAKGRTEIQTTLFLLGSGTKAEHIAEPTTDPSFWKALAVDDDDDVEASAGPQVVAPIGENWPLLQRS